MEENVLYTFKKKYVNASGEISEGRAITFFRGALYMDGLMIPEPYASDIRKLFSDKEFVKEYIKETKMIKNKV